MRRYDQRPLMDRFMEQVLLGGAVSPRYEVRRNQPVISLKLGGSQKDMPLPEAQRAVALTAREAVEIRVNNGLTPGQLVNAAQQLGKMIRILTPADKDAADQNPLKEETKALGVLADRAFDAVLNATGKGYSENPPKRFAQLESLAHDLPLSGSRAKALQERFVREALPGAPTNVAAKMFARHPDLAELGKPARTKPVKAYGSHRLA